MKITNRIIFTFLSTSSLILASSLSYSGTTGLLEIPTSRIQKDYNTSIFYFFDKPYSHYGLSTTIFPNIELNSHLTSLSNSINTDKKDKIISIKALIYPESTYFPAVAYGMDDIWGDANYSSKYIVFSKRIGYLDFSLGYAVGRLGGSNELQNYKGSSYTYLKKSSFKDGGFFGGIEFFATPKLSFILEGTSIKYEKDKKNPFYNKDKPKSRLNFGLRYHIKDNLSSQISLQRGDTLSFGLSYNFLLYDKYKKRKNIKYTRNLYENLKNNKFSNIRTETNNNSIWIEADNKNTYYDIVTLSKAAHSFINSDKKDDYEYLYLDLNKTNKKVFKLNKKEFLKYKYKDVSNTYMKKALSVSNTKNKLYKDFTYKKKENIKTFNKKRFYYDISVSSKNYLKEGKEPILNKSTIDLNGKYKLFSNLDINSTIKLPIYNNMDDSKNTSSYDRYKNPYLTNLNLSYNKNFTNNQYINFDAGILSQKYLGFNTEYQKIFLDDKFAISLQYQNVFKRKENNIFDTYSKNHDAKFLNLYYQISAKKRTHFGLKIGEFLNNDKGYRIDLARSYGRFIFGTYFTRTKDKDYESNKGLYVKIYFDKPSYLSTNQKALNINMNSLENNQAEFINFDNSLFNKLSNENNLQLIKNNIFLLK